MQKICYYLFKVYCSQACAYCSRSRLSVTSRLSCSTRFGLSLVWLCSDFPRTCFFFFFWQRHIWAAGAWDPSPLCPCPEVAQGTPHWSKTLCDIPGVYFSRCHHPAGLQTPFFFLNCHNLGNVCGLRHQTSLISIPKLNCPCCRSSGALLKLLVKPAEGRGKVEGFGHWMCSLSLLTSFF